MNSQRYTNEYQLRTTGVKASNLLLKEFGKDFFTDYLRGHNIKIPVIIESSQSSRISELFNYLEDFLIQQQMNSAVDTGLNYVGLAKNALASNPNDKLIGAMLDFLRSLNVQIEVPKQNSPSPEVANPSELPNEDVVCSICNDIMADSDTYRTTGCRNYFHGRCLSDWCRMSNEAEICDCPKCGAPISINKEGGKNRKHKKRRSIKKKINKRRRRTIKKTK